MSALSKHRGHDIVFSNGVWLYQSDKTPVSMDKTRKCGHCGKGQTEEGYDGCIGNLPAVKNACCGHGVEADRITSYNVCYTKLLRKTLRSRVYKADFKYLDVKSGMETVEDVKGMKTQLYSLKRQLFLSQYPQYRFIET